MELSIAQSSAAAAARWGGTGLISPAFRVSHEAAARQLSQVIPEPELAILSKLAVVDRIFTSSDPPPYSLVHKMVF